MEKFKAADVDQDQLLNPTEMVSLFNFETSPAVLDVVVQHTLKSKDRNHDGVLSAKEFWEIGAGEQLREQEVADFRKLDKDRIDNPQVCKSLMSCDCFSCYVVSSCLSISDQLGPTAMFGSMFSQLFKLPAACTLYFWVCCTHSFSYCTYLLIVWWFDILIWLIDWFDWSIDWLTDWFDWLIDWFIGWLIDWLIASFLDFFVFLFKQPNIWTLISWEDGNGVLNVSELRSWESGIFHIEDAMMDLLRMADKDTDPTGANTWWMNWYIGDAVLCLAHWRATT